MNMRRNYPTSTIAETRYQPQDDMLPSSRRPYVDDSLNSLQTGLPSGRSSASGFNFRGTGQKRYFHSRRIDKNTEIPKPWTAKKEPKTKWYTIFPLIGVFIGFVLCALECWQGYNSVVNKNYCLIYDDDFSSGSLNEDVWTKEVSVGGFGPVQPRLFLQCVLTFL